MKYLYLGMTEYLDSRLRGNDSFYEALEIFNTQHHDKYFVHHRRH